MKEVYQTNEDISVVGDTLEDMFREGARRMLAAALSEEVNGFLGREPYERSDEFRGYRNGWELHTRRSLCWVRLFGIILVCEHTSYIRNAHIFVAGAIVASTRLSASAPGSITPRSNTGAPSSDRAIR